MKLRKTASIFAIITGLGIIGVWTMLLMTGNDPQLQNELETIPASITMAIISDMLTGAVLLAGGIGLLVSREWSVKVFLLSMGFLFYSVINAAGFYGQRGDIVFVIMFTVIFVMAVVFTVMAVRKNVER
jgi:hypothetical protein